ncbi:hypothetical protein QS306_09480 [Paraburkholderia bonniea]|uniref:hypothetical protein n=1 Tax=Paraburkholderia bonniea TaxID=2152891 RepID=UPI001290FFC4|nr:hypothetical protein [Paraburkholderia bonniea]WJF89353.1 hypothetical protein QS306_09480 [Paraburkholderia bonniea]WJF92668.1 hypothetical protein QS308_09490 [Paraburkholderia bonniea]
MFELLDDALLKTLHALPQHAGHAPARDDLFHAARMLEQTAHAVLTTSSATGAQERRIVAEGLNATAELCQLAAA